MALETRHYLGCQIHRAGARPRRPGHDYRPCIPRHQVREPRSFVQRNSAAPLMLPDRHMEDFVTWVDTSKLKRTIMRYNDEVSRIRTCEVWVVPYSCSSWTISTCSDALLSNLVLLVPCVSLHPPRPASYRRTRAKTSAALRHRYQSATAALR